MANPIFLQELRQFNDPLSESDLLLFKIKRRVNMPADEDMGVRYSSFLTQLNLDRFVKKAGDTMTGDLVYVNNRGVFGTSTGGQTRSIFKLDNADRIQIGHVNHQLMISASIDPKVMVGSSEFVMYHSGNANKSNIDWRARDLVADQTLWVNGESTLGNLTIRKLSAIYGYDAGNLKVRMIGIDADDDVAVGVTTKRFGILVKDPNEIWAVQEEGNPAKQWRVLTTGNYSTHLNSIYVLKTQTVNGKALAGNITLNAVDVGAVGISGNYTMTGDLSMNGGKVSIVDGGSSSRQFEALSGQNRAVFRLSAGAAILGTQIGNDWKGYLKVDPINGLLYADVSGVVNNVYHQGFKPTFTDVGAAPAKYGIGETALSKVAQDQVLGGLWRDASISSAGITLPYDGTPSQAFIRVDMSRGVLSFGTRFGATTKPISWQDVYSVNNKPTANDLNAYTKQEVDQKVVKTVTVNAPAGVVAGKYYPILISGSLSSHVKVNTRRSGGADPMNNCSFDGVVRTGGWTDQTTFVDGVFTIYEQGERALAGIATPTQVSRGYAVYVEARAFPVDVTVDANETVQASATDITFDTTVFKAGIGLSDSVGTNAQWTASFTSGSGRYYNSHLIASATGSSGGGGATFGQVNMFLAVPEEPWILLDGRAFDTAKYPRLAQLYPSGRVPDVTKRYPKFWSGTEGAGNAYARSFPEHSHTFSANTSTFDYGTKSTSTFDYGSKGANTNNAGGHTHSYNTYGGPYAGGEGFRADASNGRYLQTGAAGDHAHWVAIAIGAHNHSVGIGAHSHSVSGTTSTAGSGVTVETDRFVFYACIYAA